MLSRKVSGGNEKARRIEELEPSAILGALSCS